MSDHSKRYCLKDTTFITWSVSGLLMISCKWCFSLGTCGCLTVECVRSNNIGTFTVIACQENHLKRTSLLYTGDLDNFLLIDWGSYRKSSNKRPGAYFKFRRRRGGGGGGRLFEGGAYSKEGAYLIFSQIVAVHDHFSDTFSAHNHQHKLFIDKKADPAVYFAAPLGLNVFNESVY